MKTQPTKLDRIMIITVVAGLILATLAFLKPAQAEAGVVVTARVGNVGVSVAPDSPRAVVVQTGPRIYRCDLRTRPPRPLRGHYVWIPGHYEKVLVKKNCRRIHQSVYLETRKGKSRKKGSGPVATGNRGRRAHRHDHYREVWVPGHWERI